MLKIVEDFFNLKNLNTNIRTEVLAGITTFMTMAYIIFVNPAMISQTGMDFGAAMMATCISAAISTILMGLYANYPIALAPGMGENAFFTYTVCLTLGISWQVALGCVFIVGILFIILTLTKVRQALIDAIPASLRYGIAAGIGIFITFIGLIDAGITAGGRSGLTSVVTGLLFLAALFFSPLIKMIGGGYKTDTVFLLHPVTAPALVIVGSMMLHSITKIDWKDYSELIPAFLVIVMIPLSFSIATGIAIGFISFAVLKLLAGRGKEASWLIYLFAILFILRFLYLKVI